MSTLKDIIQRALGGEQLKVASVESAPAPVVSTASETEKLAESLEYLALNLHAIEAPEEVKAAHFHHFLMKVAADAAVEEGAMQDAMDPTVIPNDYGVDITGGELAPMPVAISNTVLPSYIPLVAPVGDMSPTAIPTDDAAPGFIPEASLADKVAASFADTARQQLMQGMVASGDLNPVVDPVWGSWGGGARRPEVIGRGLVRAAKRDARSAAALNLMPELNRASTDANALIALDRAKSNLHVDPGYKNIKMLSTRTPALEQQSAIDRYNWSMRDSLGARAGSGAGAASGGAGMAGAASGGAGMAGAASGGAGMAGAAMGSGSPPRPGAAPGSLGHALAGTIFDSKAGGGAGGGGGGLGGGGGALVGGGLGGGAGGGIPTWGKVLGGAALTAGALYGGKKLYDRYKSKQQAKEAGIGRVYEMLKVASDLDNPANIIAPREEEPGLLLAGPDGVGTPAGGPLMIPEIQSNEAVTAADGLDLTEQFNNELLQYISENGYDPTTELLLDEAAPQAKIAQEGGRDLSYGTGVRRGAAIGSTLGGLSGLALGYPIARSFGATPGQAMLAGAAPALGGALSGGITGGAIGAGVQGIRRLAASGPSVEEIAAAEDAKVAALHKILGAL
jgi:hypothetical protein